MTESTLHSDSAKTESSSPACCDREVLHTCCAPQTKSACCGPQPAPQVCGCGDHKSRVGPDASS